MANSIVRLGLVGAGRWGRNYIRTITGIDDVTLIGVASRNPETAALVPHGCRIVADWRPLIASPDIDGIVVASPPASHADILIAAVNAGKSVLVEKPLVTTQAQLPAITRVSANTSCTIIVEHTHLFHPAFRSLKATARTLGPIRAIRSSAGAEGPYRRDVSVLWDWAPHDVAMALDLVPGAPKVESACVIARRQVGDVAANRLHLHLILEHEINCHIKLSTLDQKHRWFAVDFDDSTLIYSDQSAQPLRLFMRAGAQLDEDGEAVPVQPALPLTIAVREFAVAVLAKDPKRESLALGCQVVEILARCEDLMNKTPCSYFPD